MQPGRIDDQPLLGAALRGDYETADRIAAEILEATSRVDVLARSETPSACPAIERRLSIERGDDGAYRLVVDGYTNGPPRANIAPTLWPESGFESPARAVAEARARLTETEKQASSDREEQQAGPGDREEAPPHGT